jgi:hypothetical protein
VLRQKVAVLRRAGVRQPGDVPPARHRAGLIYVFESKGGAPTNPDWCRNLTAAGDGSNGHPDGCLLARD